MGKWILAFLIAAAVLFLCWKLRGVMLTPVCRGKGQSLELILRVSGASPEGNVTLWTKQTNSAAPCSSSEP